MLSMCPIQFETCKIITLSIITQIYVLSVDCKENTGNNMYAKPLIFHYKMLIWTLLNYTTMLFVTLHLIYNRSDNDMLVYILSK